MTDNEIIKALECCIKNDCAKCKAYDETNEEIVDCLHAICRNFFDLINHQKAEIERLEELLDSSVSSERNAADNIDYEKTEAIKEFAHLVIERNRNGVIQISDIPDLVKEMTEVETNQRKEDEGE